MIAPSVRGPVSGRSSETAALERTRRRDALRFNWELADDEVLDMGYSEFVCCTALAEELLDGGMTRVNGVEGFLMIICRYQNAVHFKWCPRNRRIMAPYLAEAAS